MMRVARTTIALLTTLALAGSVAVGSTQAATGGNPDFTVTKVDVSKYPDVRVAFVKDDSKGGLPRFKVTENGSVAGDVNAYPGRIGQYEQNPKPVLMLAIDTSDSMAADNKIEHAKAAAVRLLDESRPGDRIGLVTFGATSTVVRKPTSDIDQLKRDIAGLKLTHGTALYDGVWDAEHAFPKDASRRIVVLLSDGADTGSKHTSADVITRATGNDTEVYGVVLPGEGADPTTITRLANATSGTAETVSSVGDLDTVFTELGRQLLRGYWLEYQSTQPDGGAVKLTIDAAGYDSITSSYSTPIVRAAGGDAITLKPAPRVQPSRPLISLPGGVFGLFIAALPFALLMTWGGIAFVLRRTRTRLDKRVEPFIQQRNANASHDDERSAAAGIKGMLAPLFALTDSALGQTSLFARFRRRLEQADLPLREVELLYAMIATGTIGAIVALIVQPPLVVMAAIPIASFMLPYGWVVFRAKRRKKAFESQLADVLGTIAASLKAGHSFNQSMAAVIKEAPDPTAQELKRVMAETRLGLPMEIALENMAERMDSADFDFAVTTVNIQRTVGGSLSEILEMVSDTVRGRQQFHKKVKALTSMGSMSAYVLLGMPIFMAGVLTLMSPSYMTPLWHTPMGHKLLMAGAFFMFLGWISCKKIVTIKT